MACREAIDDNSKGGILIGGRRIRLEMAKNTAKLYVTIPKDVDRQDVINSFASAYPMTKCRPISIPNENTFLIKLDSNCDYGALIERINSDHPDWIIQLHTDQQQQNGPIQCGNVAISSSQRQSGLFQLSIPESGVLPVSPITLAKINSFSPTLQYSLTPLEQPIIPITPAVMNRLYEDWHADGQEATFHDPGEAREAAARLNPPLGEWEGDVFLGRLDNQKVGLKCIFDLVCSFGNVSFVRLCNRSIIREDGGKRRGYCPNFIIDHVRIPSI